MLELRDGGMPTLLVCSGSHEQHALRDMADVVVAGPDGVITLLRELVDDIRHLRATVPRERADHLTCGTRCAHGETAA